jgi:hypothetical protein
MNKRGPKEQKELTPEEIAKQKANEELYRQVLDMEARFVLLARENPQLARGFLRTLDDAIWNGKNQPAPLKALADNSWREVQELFMGADTVYLQERTVFEVCDKMLSCAEGLVVVYNSFKPIAWWANPKCQYEYSNWLISLAKKENTCVEEIIRLENTAEFQEIQEEIVRHLSAGIKLWAGCGVSGIETVGAILIVDNSSMLRVNMDGRCVVTSMEISTARLSWVRPNPDTFKEKCREMTSVEEFKKFLDEK